MLVENVTKGFSRWNASLTSSFTGTRFKASRIVVSLSGWQSGGYGIQLCSFRNDAPFVEDSAIHSASHLL